MNHRTNGNEGEQAAGDFLAKRGWTVLDRNVRRGRGEIDIVARRRGVVALIEVKRRSSTAFGMPAEAVNAEKQRRILSAASIYLQENGLSEANIRFDIIEILADKIRHIEAAFDATDFF